MKTDRTPASTFLPAWAFALVLLLANCSPDDAPAPSHFQEEEKSAPTDWMYFQRAFPDNHIDQSAYREAFKQIKKERKNGPARNAGSWELAGPTNVGGRITDIALHPTDQSIMYAGTTAGGLFKSTDGGENWAAVFEEEGANSIGDIALAPSEPNTLYLGIGEANGFFISGAFFGDGIFKSTDGGANWEHKGLSGTNHIGRIVVDAQNPDRAYVAATGVLYGHNAERGVYRTLNGGDSWQKVLFLTDSTAAIDLAVHPNNADIVYAAMWERTRSPYGRNYGGETSGVYRSFDGGDTWAQLTNGLPADSPETGRIGLAISPSQPNVLYAAYTTDPIRNFFDALYKSTNAGTSWTKAADDELANVFGFFGWFFGNLRVHPTDPDDVFCLGLPLYRSLDGGTTWFDNTDSMHVDFHALEFHPQNPDLIVAGNDGGIYISQDGGLDFQKTGNLPNNLVYEMAIDAQQPERLYCGMQDQGTQRTLSGGAGAFGKILGADGYHVIVDPTDNDFIYATWQGGALFRSSDGGENFVNVFFPNDVIRTSVNTPVVLSPHDPQTLFLGANRLWKSTDRGSNWAAISPDLTNGLHPNGNLSYAAITAIGLSPTDPSVIYVGTDDGNVHVTFDGGGEWESISEGLPLRFVTALAVHPEDANTAYITFSGFRKLDYQPHILRTDDGGESWEDISANLPEIPINDLVIDPDQPALLYIANDLGVWHSTGEGTSWQLLGDGLPLTIVSDLLLHPPTKTLHAATYGRSIHKIDVTDITATGERPRPFVFSEMEIWPNPVNAYTRIRFELPGAEKGKLEVFTINGKKIKTIAEQQFNVGENEILWNASGLPAGVYILRLEVAGRVMAGEVVR